MTTLKNVTSVLQLFRDHHRELSVDETMTLLGMSKSSAARLLASMRDAHLLESVGRPPRYRIGPLFLEVAGAHRSFQSSSLNDKADAALIELCEATGYTGYVSVLQGSDIVVVRIRHGSHPLQVVTPLGHRVKAFETAIGRALLSRFRDDDIARLYDGKLSPSTPNSPQSVAAILRRLEQAREKGVAEACDEALPGIGSLAISLRSPYMDELVGVCLSYPSSVTSQKDKQRMTECLLAAGEKIGAEIHDEYWLNRKSQTSKGQASKGGMPFKTTDGSVVRDRKDRNIKRMAGR